MGISDLQQMIENDPVLAKAGVKTVDIVKDAWSGNAIKLQFIILDSKY